jgi:heat shock protein HslJ
MEGYMRALILAAALTVACTSFANAAEVKKDTIKAPAPVVASKTMTDTDMDKVTAGGKPEIKGQGLYTASLARASSNASSQGQLHGIGRCNNSLCF